MGLSGDTSGCHDWAVLLALGGPGMSLNIPLSTEQPPPPTKNHLTQMSTVPGLRSPDFNENSDFPSGWERPLLAVV